VLDNYATTRNRRNRSPEPVVHYHTYYDVPIMDVITVLQWQWKAISVSRVCLLFYLKKTPVRVLHETMEYFSVGAVLQWLTSQTVRITCDVSCILPRLTYNIICTRILFCFVKCCCLLVCFYSYFYYRHRFAACWRRLSFDLPPRSTHL